MTRLKSYVLPAFVAVISFIILSLIYMYPSLEGKRLQQTDMVQHRGMAKELDDFREKTGEETLWTNSIFGGMPAYLISTRFTANVTKHVHKILTLNNWRPVCFIFMYLFGFYIALLCFRVNKWLAIAGAVAYGFSTYFITFIGAGHISKVFAIGYMPPIIGGVHLTFRGKYWQGGVITGLFLALQLRINHVQITYYTLMIVVIYGVIELVYAIREKRLPQFIKQFSILFLFALLALGSNLANLWTTYEYGKFSIRGKSELTTDQDNRTTGLDRDYVTQYSYGIGETFILLIPNFKGGSSISELPQKSETFDLLKKIQGPAAARKAIKSMPMYWGSQPFTSGPSYIGASVIFLFVLGLFLIKGRIRWWIIVTTILSIVLAWGDNFAVVTNFFLDYVPGYNKFRAVATTIIMAAFTIPLMGILAIDSILIKSFSKKELTKYITSSFYITGGICLFFILTAGALFDFSSTSDQRYLAQGADEFVEALRSDRLMLLRQDAFRSIIFILLTAGILYLFVNQKISTKYFIPGLALVILIDIWAIDKRYLNNDDFVTKRQHRNTFTRSKADQYILQDTDPNYRVLNLSLSPFQDATTSYYHKSIGGYHGAKMRRYQELIDHEIQQEMQMIIAALRKGDFALVDRVLQKTNTLNMLNTRYIIYNPEAPPIHNKYASGNAWFVNKIQWAENADREIEALNTLRPSSEAVVDKRFSETIHSASFSKDTTLTIQLEKYEPNNLVYSSSSDAEQAAIFSEIYYPKGWKATIDGEPAEIFRTNYILRGLIVPPGKHTIEFRFEPLSYYLGSKISLASSILLIIIFIGISYIEVRKLLTDRELKS